MSWCLGDVVALHGPAGLRSQDDRMGAAEAETVYPGMIPAEGELMTPEENYLPIPTEAMPPMATNTVMEPKKKNRLSRLRLFGKKNDKTTVTQ